MPIANWAARVMTEAGIVGYVAAIGVVAGVVLAVPLVAVSGLGVSGWTLIVLAVLAVAPTSDLAVALINRGFTNDLDPKTLPALELRDGVPANLRTMVVVPTLLTSRAGVTSRSNAWKCIIWRVAMAISASGCSPTGPIRPPRQRLAMTTCSLRRSTVSHS